MDPNLFDSPFGSETGSGNLGKLLLVVPPFKRTAKKKNEKNYNNITKDECRYHHRQILLVEKSRIQIWEGYSIRWFGWHQNSPQKKIS